MQPKSSEFIENFSSGLKYARLARGLSQAELAQQLGENQSVISNWEGRQNGPGRKLAKVAEFFGVRIDPHTGRWGSVAQPFSSSVLRDEPTPGTPGPGDLAFVLAEFPEDALLSMINRALADQDLDLVERVRRARMFLDELARRGRAVSSGVDAAAAAALRKAVSRLQRSDDPGPGCGPKSTALPPTDKAAGPGAGAPKH